MDYRLPQGTLSIAEAVDWLARRRDDEWTIWSALQQVAWVEIREVLRKGILRAYVLDSAGQSHEADRAQFAAPAPYGFDQPPMMLSLQWFRATTTRRITHFGKTHMLRLLQEDREEQVSGKLFFFLTDLKDVFGEDALPSGKATAEARKPLPDSRLPELKRFVGDFARQQERAGGSRNEKTARAAAQEHFDEYIITRDMVRDARRAAGCLGKPGKKPIHAAK
jgi:hypothetical protein